MLSEGTATTYDKSVNKSEKRIPASRASQIGFFCQRQSVMAWATEKAAHWPADRRRNAVSRPAGATP